MPAHVAFAVDYATAPNSPAPPNGHWYYRTDPTQQRKRWYLRANSEASEQKAVQVAREAAPENSLGSVPQAGKYSLVSFKEFMAQRGGAKLSDEDIKTLYLQFLECSRANNWALHHQGSAERNRRRSAKGVPWRGEPVPQQPMQGT